MQNPIAEIAKIKKTMDSAETPINMKLHIEDAWFLNEENIDKLIKMNPFSVGLTWNENNPLAGGAHGDGGLTTLGRKTIEKLAKAGIAIDAAHLNEKSFWAVANAAEKSNAKFFCSHTCFSAVHPHPRNISDEQIKKIIDMGGVIGLTFVGDFLSSKEKSNIGDIYLHVRHFLDKFGDKHLAIGTDFLGTDNPPKGMRSYRDTHKLKECLISKGIPQSSVKNIMHKNAKSFISSQRIAPAAHQGRQP